MHSVFVLCQLLVLMFFIAAVPSHSNKIQLDFFSFLCYAEAFVILSASLLSDV